MQPTVLALDEDLGARFCGDAQRTLRQRDGVRRDLPRLDGEFRIVAVAVMRVDEPHLVLPGREQDVAFVALADLAVAVKDLDGMRDETDRNPAVIS